MNESIIFNMSMPNLYGHVSGMPENCYSNGHYNADCIFKLVCNQLNHWVIKTGIIIIVSFIIMSWILWYFLKYGYKYIPDYSGNEMLIKIFGDMRNLETRIYWDMFIRNKFLKIMTAYIAVVVYLNW